LKGEKSVANPILTKSFVAGGAIGPNRCVKFSASGTVVLSAAAADLTIGATRPQITGASGDRMDVVLEGIADMVCGGVVTRGTAVTSDAAGAILNAAAGNRSVGVALESGVAGDIVPVLVSPGVA
jgi:hypothetical protein